MFNTEKHLLTLRRFPFRSDYPEISAGQRDSMKTFQGMFHTIYICFESSGIFGWKESDQRLFVASEKQWIG